MMNLNITRAVNWTTTYVLVSIYEYLLTHQSHLLLLPIHYYYYSHIQCHLLPAHPKLYSLRAGIGLLQHHPRRRTRRIHSWRPRQVFGIRVSLRAEPKQRPANRLIQHEDWRIPHMHRLRIASSLLHRCYRRYCRGNIHGDCSPIHSWQ